MPEVGELKQVSSLIANKMAALLHDPPHKAWFITSKWSRSFIEREMKRLSGEPRKACDELLIQWDKFEEKHECVAYWIMKRLNVGNHSKIIVEEADRCASSYDRWLLVWSVAKDFWSSIRTENIVLANQFSGDLFAFDYDVDFMQFYSLISELSESLSKVKDGLLKYHVLFALYEPLYYEYALKPTSAPPADTRIPTHTIFDHLYACASIVNWIREGELKGLLVVADLAGVQRFIRVSRKLKDLWISSWLISVLAWAIVRPFLEKLGPDVIISPTARFNPFYYHLLIGLLEERGVDAQVLQKIKEIGKRYAHWREPAPLYAIIPPTTFLVLPSYEVLNEAFEGKMKNRDELAGYLCKRYADLWESICKIVEEHLSKLGEVGQALINEVETLGIKSCPPLQLRIAIVEIPKDLGEPIDSKDVFSKAFETAWNTLKETKLFKIEPKARTNLTAWTEKLYNEGRYHICTVCASYPAIVLYHSAPEELKRQLDMDEGEHLCPYCAMKRLLARPEVLEKVIRKLLGWSQEITSNMVFPSISDIATIEFRERAFKELVEGGSEDVREFVRRLVKGVKGGPAISVYPPIQRMLREAEEAEDLEGQLLAIIPSEGSFLSRRLRTEEPISKVISKLKVPLRIYYAMVRADGDFIGALLRGKVGEALQTDYLKLLESIIEEGCGKEARNLIHLAAEGREDEIKKLLMSHGLKDPEKVDKIAGELRSTLGMLKDGIIKVSPSYYVHISRSLMVTAIKEVELAEKLDGFVVYSGGDDLLVLIPSSKVLDFVRESRRRYSEGDSKVKGFWSISKALIPSLGLASRSYSVLFCHYRHPMYDSLAFSVEMLDEYAKKMCTKIKGVHGERKKDVLALLYAPRGVIRASKHRPLAFKEAQGVEELELALIPLSLSEDKSNPIEVVKELVNEMEYGRLSRSLIYDLFNNLKTIKSLTSQPSILKAYLKYLVSRNVKGREDEKFVEAITQQLTTLADVLLVSSSKQCATPKIPQNVGVAQPLLEHLILAMVAYSLALREFE